MFVYQLVLAGLVVLSRVIDRLISGLAYFSIVTRLLVPLTGVVH